MSQEIPKLDLLIKMMKMTDAEDAMALVAIRKANAVLKENGWDWEKVLRGKVTVIADPFGTTIAPAPKATPAPQTYKPTAWASQAQPAANPWPNGQQPKPKPKPQPAPQPRPAGPPPVAPAGPLMFRRDATQAWCIASYAPLNIQGQKVFVEKRDGTKAQETLGPFVEQDLQGYYLYRIAKASKWKQKSADQLGVADLI